ncbi:glycosyltransferase family 2 protein [Ruegeria sp. AU67]|uniref:glycosyltransferase family 2 protein n=1 Tax=Ruegeria sp. AU67 TaxID=2108530 RepID=UPI000D68827F|nr:glycosyltransferase family 2 protein [Ruegeria sp. AU67]
MSKLKIFLMTKNEGELIKDWILYHAHLFGIENIHILDGSDDEQVLQVYELYKQKGLNVHHSNSGLDDLAIELTQLMHAHKGTGNFLIKLDTDEFLAVASPAELRPRSPKLDAFRKAFIEKYDGKSILKVTGALDKLFEQWFRRKRISLDGIEAFFDRLPVTGQRYKASFTMWSMPVEAFSQRPCVDVLEFTPSQFTHLKSFFHSESFVSVDLGCHVGSSTDNEGFIDTGLTVIHYHSTSVEDSMRRARQVLRSHGYIDQGASSAQEIEKLSRLEGQLISSWHKIDQYLKFLRSKGAGERMIPSELNQQHPYYRQARPRRMTLVRDTLQSIDT